MSKERNIYVMLSATELKTGKLIRFFTRYKYNHVSISIDNELKYLYSFSRLYKRTTLYAGLVKESALRYKDSKVKIYKIPIDNYSYKKIKRYLNILDHSKNKYIYNFLSAFFFLFHKKINIDKSYTCIEFCILILSRYVKVLNLDENKFYSIKDLDKILSKYLIFKGDFYINKSLSWDYDDYLDNSHILYNYFNVVKNIFILIYRFVKY